MSDTKFTPGPWRTALTKGNFIFDCEGNQVAETLGTYVSDYGRMEANATLIAAAPDMYQVVVDLIEIVDASHPSAPAYLDEARAALTKARGGK